MAKLLSNVYTGTDTFATWIEKTNIGLDTISTVTVTTAANSTGALTTGNAVVNGVLSATTLVAPTALRGGSVATPGTLTITSAVDVQNTFINVVNTDANVTLGGTGKFANVAIPVDLRANVGFSGSNVTFGSTTTTNLNGNVFITSDMQYVVASNTNIGANTTAAQNVYTFAKASYSAAEIVATAKTLGGNNQIVKLLVAHDGTTAISTAYGTIASPSGANVGVFSTELVGANVNVKFLQSSPNTSLKVVAQLIK